MWVPGIELEETCAISLLRNKHFVSIDDTRFRRCQPLQFEELKYLMFSYSFLGRMTRYQSRNTAELSGGMPTIRGYGYLINDKIERIIKD